MKSNTTSFDVNLEGIETDEIFYYSGYWFTDKKERERSQKEVDTLYFVSANMFNNKKVLKSFIINNPNLHQVFKRELHDIQWKNFDLFRDKIKDRYIKTSKEEYKNIIESWLSEGFISFKYLFETEGSYKNKIIRQKTIKDSQIEINSCHDINNRFVVLLTYDPYNLYSVWDKTYSTDEIIMKYCDLWWR